MMIVYGVGSDSGFGLGTDGIIDDYDDETGISVILWCLIFLFLLIVTIWFYITQLMPYRNAKCELDDDAEDEDERVANRLLDQLATKTSDKSNDEPSTCEPSTSRGEDYEVIDGEITIHYSNYEREPNVDDNNDPQETRATIPRRPSMEEMSLIFPGFLPSISEEEEFEETCNEEIVYQSGSRSSDTTESNVNVFIEHESSNEHNKSDHKTQHEEILYHGDDSNTSRVVANRKGKQPIGYVSAKVRRRNIQKNLYDEEIQSNDSIPRDKNNESYVRYSEPETAVLRATAAIKKTHQHEQNVYEFHDKIENNFISGDPENQTITSGKEHGMNSLIIIDESTVALETPSPDANENTNLNTTDKHSEDTAKTSKEEPVSEERLNEIDEKVKYNCESASDHVDIVPSTSTGNKLRSSRAMEDQLTHSWTFYAMSDTNSNIENYLEYYDRTNDKEEIPQIVVDFHSDEKQPNCNIVEHSDNNALDTFETDIDVDDIDLDELEGDDNAESDDLNCFVKRHVSVTDLDKILTSHGIVSDNTEQYKDDIDSERDLDELMRAVSEPAHKTNKETTTELRTTAGDHKIVNESKQNSHKVLTGDYIYSYTTISSDHVLNEDCTNKESDVFNLKTSRSKQNVPLPNKKQCSINKDNVDTLRNNAVQSKKQFEGYYLKRDLEKRDVDEKKLETITHVENCINTQNKNTNDYNTTNKENTSVDTKQKTTKISKIEGTKKEMYSYTSNVSELKEHRTISAQEANHCNLSSIDSSLSNIKNNDRNDKTLSCSTGKDREIITEKTDRRETTSRASTERSSTRTISTEKNMDLTAEELIGKIDLSKPVYTSSQNEVIIGRKKSRKDSSPRLFTNVTSNNTMELSRKLSETSSEPSRTASRLSRSKSEPSRRAVEQAVTSRNAFESSTTNSESSHYLSQTSHNATQQTVMSRSISEHSFATRSTTEQIDTSCNSVEQTGTITSKQLKERAITSRSAAEQTISHTTSGADVTEIPVMQNLDVKQPEGKNKMNSSNEVSRTKNNTMNWTTKVASKLNTHSKAQDNQIQVEKRTVHQQPTINKSFVLLSETRELQTLISIKDIPDSRVELEISTTKHCDDAKTRKTSTGLEKAEEILANRIKRLEEEKKNDEEFTPTASKARQIDWDDFLIDGLNLQKVDNVQEKMRDSLHCDIILTPPLVRKPIVENNEVQVCENCTQQFCNPREIDWDWFECEENSSKPDNKDGVPSKGLKSKDNSTYNNVKNHTDSFVRHYCANRECYVHKSEENNKCEFDKNEDVVVVTDCTKNKDEHNRNLNGTADVILNDPTAAIDNNEEKFATRHESLSDSNDVFSSPSYPSSEPEFPVRLTKSSSELRNAEMQDQSCAVYSNFLRSDRSKSQTDVFAPQGSHDDVFTDSEDRIFKTKITVDEVYKNRRRIVILNVRKKSPGKTRWKSLSDLESAKKHVLRFRSIGSHSELAEEKLSAGDDRALFAENNDSDLTLSDKVPTSSSRGCHHSNDANIAAPTPSCKQTGNRTMENTMENCDLTLKSRGIDIGLQESTFKTFELRLQEEDSPSKVTSGVDIEPIPLSSDRIQLETIEPQLCESEQSRGNTYEDDIISTAENPAPRERVGSPTESEVEMSHLQRQVPLSPVEEFTKQTTENRCCSPGTIFAVSRHSPTPLTDREVEKCLQRLPSLPTTLPDIADKQDGQNVTSPTLSRPLNIENEKITDLSKAQQEKSMSDFVNNSSDFVNDPEIEAPLQALNRKRNEQDNSYSSKSETLSAVNKASLISIKELTNETRIKRQSSISPVNDITVRRSPSPLGTFFAVRGQSPSPLKINKGDNSSVQDLKDSGKIFAVSRHSPTPLLDAERKTIIEKIKPSSPVQFVQTAPELNRKDYDTAISMSRENVADSQCEDYGTSESLQSRKPARTDNQSKEYETDVSSTKRTMSSERYGKEYDNNRMTGASHENKLPDKRTGSLGRNEKYKDERPSQTSPSISPGLTEPSQEYASRHSSVSSSGYGGSRVSPSSSLERRYTWEKLSKPSLSPDLVFEQKRESSSRRSSASSGSVFLSRISPTPSTDSECSSIDDRRSSGCHRSQRGSYRSGTVFAVSGYNSAASDSESKRPDSASPRDNDRKHITKHVTNNRDNKERHKAGDKEYIDQTSKSKEGTPRDIKDPEEACKESLVLNTIEKREETNIVSSVQSTGKKHSIFNRVPSSKSDDFGITQDGWLAKKNNSFPRTSDQTFGTGDQGDRAKRTNDPATDDRAYIRNNQISEIPERNVLVTDLDSLLNGTSTLTTTSVAPGEQANLKENEMQLEVTDNIKSRAATTISPTGVQETDLDAIFDSANSSSKEDRNKETEIPKIKTIERNTITITSVVLSDDKHTVHMTQQDVADCNSTPSPMLDDLDEDIFTRVNPKPRRDPNDMTFSSDADSETSSLSSVPVKSKIKHTKASLEAVKSPPQGIFQSSDSSSATSSTPERFMFLHPDLTSTPEAIKALEITENSTSMNREATKEPSYGKRHDKSKGNSLLTDFSYGAVQVKTRSTSDTRVISTEASKSAFTPVRSRTIDRRSISQEYMLDSLANQEEVAPNCNAIEESAFKDLTDSYKSMPDLHTAHGDNEVVDSPKKTVPYHSRLSAHTRIWLSQTAGIDTSDLCKDESGGSEIFLFPSKRFQPGKNVDASFLSIASESEDIPDNVSSRPSSPMSEFSFAGDSPFGAEADNELRIIACGHRYCDQEEIIRGQEKTTFTSCPACYTYYCSRECRQAHWKEHKKFCYFGRINSYMRSFIYFCHKKDNLRLLLSNIGIRNYATKGRGSVMVTFASPKQARKFMTSGCVLLPSPPSYSTVRELIQEGVVSKHKVNLVHQVKDYDPTKEFVLNLAVVAGRLEDLPRHPVPRHKLNTVLECIKVPLSESITEEPKNTVPDTSKETRVFYLPKCSRHGFINDMEARRHYCRNISKSLKSYGIRLKKDYPEAYDSLCMYVEKNKSFKPLTVYGNEGSKIITCKIMPEASISAV